MLNLKNKLNYEYNSMYDILYIRLFNSYDSYGEEKEDGIIFNYDYKTNELCGFDIWDFKSRINSNEKISLSIDIDLKAIYISL